jgi:hypothetical protein
MDQLLVQNFLLQLVDELPHTNAVVNESVPPPASKVVLTLCHCVEGNRSLRNPRRNDLRRFRRREVGVPCRV